MKRSGVVHVGMAHHNGFYFLEVDAQQSHIVGNADLAVTCVKKDGMGFCSLVHCDQK